MRQIFHRKRAAGQIHLFVLVTLFEKFGVSMKKHLIHTAFAFVFALLCFASVHAQAEAGGAIMAVDEGVGGGPSGGVGGGSGGSKSYASNVKPPSTRKRTAAKKTAPVQPKPKKWDGFVIGDKYSFLNFEVISADKPIYTRDAKAQGASGLVQVEVLIETNGSVIAAKGRTGNKLLWPEAERAALASKFNRPMVYGKPARAIGFLVYRFGKGED